MNKIVYFFICLSFTVLGQAPTLIADIQTKGNAEPSVTCNSNNKIYFTGNNSVNGNELWITDGSAANTYMVKDINPGPDASGIFEMIEYNGGIVFNAYTEVAGGEIWFSNGTEAGTIQIKDIFSGKTGSNPRNLTYFNGDIFFIANDSLYNTCLYKTNGTAVGTTLVKNFGLIEYYGNLKVSSSVLFISIYDDDNIVSDLWKSDGTEAGTVLVKNISNNYVSFTSDLAIYNFYYFTVTNGTNSTVWKSDGTTEGTTILGTYPGETVLFHPSGIMSTGSGIFLLPFNEPPSLIFSAPALCLEYDFVTQKVYFMVQNTSLNRTELWARNPTSLTMLKVFSNESTELKEKFIIQVNGIIYFNGHSYENGEELWKTDGTFGGTVLIKDIRAGHYGSLCQNPIRLSNSLIFFANNGLSGLEPFISNGTALGTTLIKDIKPNYFDSNPNNFNSLDNSIFLTADINESHSTLFIKRSDVYFEPLESINNSSLFKFNNKLFFGAPVRIGRVELKSIDENGIISSIVNFNPPSTVYPNEFSKLGTKFIFAATNATAMRELWISDGTTAGTVPINYTKFVPGTSDPRSITVVNNDVAYFFAKSGTLGEELWRTGGLAANTQRLTIASSGPKIDASTKMGVLNGEVFFSASGLGNNYELWKSDGVQVVLVKEINTGASGSFPSGFITIGNTLYFYANTTATSYELWKTDGSVSGTMLVKDINLGLGSSNLDNLYDFNGILYFSADDGINGTELWRSDGTVAGTYMLKNINKNGGSFPREFCKINNGLYFSASDGKHGFELWKTDGTEAGTVLVYDIFIDLNGSNENSSAPSSIFNYNGTLYFSAKDGYYGREPHYFMPCENFSPTVPTDKILPSQSLHTSQSISASNKILDGNSINYLSGNSITLNPGFKVGDGLNFNTVFRADIKGCY